MNYSNHNNDYPSSSNQSFCVHKLMDGWMMVKAGLVGRKPSRFMCLVGLG